jgi:RHS repeat-associated protein
MLTRVSGGVTTRFTWDGWDLVKEDDGTNVIRYYCPQGELFSIERNSTFYQVHTDALGSVRALTDSTGAVAASYTYGAWGETLSASHPSGWTLSTLFVGAFGVRFDPTTGLHYMRNRWYDAGLGRFLSRDPIGIQGGSLYEYTLNQPTQWIDPEGTDLLTGALTVGWGVAIVEPTPFGEGIMYGLSMVAGAHIGNEVIKATSPTGAGVSVRNLKPSYYGDIDEIKNKHRIQKMETTVAEEDEPNYAIRRPSSPVDEGRARHPVDRVSPPQEKNRHPERRGNIRYHTPNGQCQRKFEQCLKNADARRDKEAGRPCQPNSMDYKLCDRTKKNCDKAKGNPYIVATPDWPWF